MLYPTIDSLTIEIPGLLELAEPAAMLVMWCAAAWGLVRIVQACASAYVKCKGGK